MLRNACHRVSKGSFEPDPLIEAQMSLAASGLRYLAPWYGRS